MLLKFEDYWLELQIFELVHEHKLTLFHLQQSTRMKGKILEYVTVVEATRIILDNANQNADALVVTTDIENVLRSNGIPITKGDCSSHVVITVDTLIG